MLAKYRWNLGNLRPFLEAGPAFRAVGNLNVRPPAHYGVTAGAGVEYQWRRVRIAPAIRYTRWANAPAMNNSNDRQDQIELLASFSYASETGYHPLGRRISFGAVAGMTVTPDFRSSSTTFTYSGAPGEPAGSFTNSFSGRRSPVAGPAFQLDLVNGLAVEADVIYHPIRNEERIVSSSGPSSSQRFTVMGEWEFPLLARCGFPAPLRTRHLRPFLALGPSFRLPQESLSPFGITGGLGLESNWRHLKIAPQFRYTHWARDTQWRYPTGIRQNQTQLLLGISF